MTRVESMMQPAVVAARDPHIAGDVLFLDGLISTGKTMMGPILSSFRRVQIQRFDHIHEFLCALRFLGRVEEDAAVVLSRMYADVAIYHLMIARESNFRPSDLSGVLRNPGGWRYLTRLFQKDGDAVLPRIEQEQPILHIHAHQMLGIAGPVFRAFGPRLKIVEMVRHPLHLLASYRTWIERFGRDARDFNIWLRFRDTHLPWWAYGWEEEYAAARPMDRVIRVIDRITGLARAMLDTLDAGTRARVLVIPFERFVLDPHPFLRDIAALLGTETTSATARVLRREKVPREMTLAGRDLGIYRRYSFQPPARARSEGEELRRRWDAAEREATPHAMEVLDRLCGDYERRHGKLA